MNGLSLAFVAGVVAALNPCGFAMLPGYLALVTQGGRTGPAPALIRAVTATIVMALGFATVFAAFGVLAVSVADLVQRYLPVATLLIGVVLVIVGVGQVLGRPLLSLRLAGAAAAGAPDARLGSMFGYGIAYALVSVSCTIAPFLAVTGIGLRDKNIGASAGYLGAYVAGFAALVGVLAVTAAVSGSAVADRLRGWTRWAPMIGGVLLVISGLYVAYYGGYELRLRGSVGTDPVIAVAGRIQQQLAGWAYRLPWPLAAAAVIAAGVAVILGIRNRRRRNVARGRDS
ncbi:cytochrome c biogenesis CcdA family protein [Mycolicibacterium sp. 141076]|uniref:cytochrome c biogenesis CcdA family protein n=1 Tax=Mycobacteriaceae TaxID=1762 RepID=UPI00092A6480|nr:MULTISPECIES: cytochrome c biogenesis CcdA family protein [Mycolicibacterium]MDX1877895.1 cytochrome c biogenesis CcdA family protein [Mycolicibacterium sp. 141076]UCZ58141.1 cytochrome c biogenesis CcdA family protein [Mycolicibacterium phocaicum]SHW42134.1 cytochrome C biogenesis proteintrans membrane region [Mycobacteroides abscessus subsp. abscessus]